MLNMNGKRNIAICNLKSGAGNKIIYKNNDYIYVDVLKLSQKRL